MNNIHIEGGGKSPGWLPWKHVSDTFSMPNQTAWRCDVGVIHGMGKSVGIPRQLQFTATACIV